ncbi:helicase HerA-like domain-containing protein [Fusibacter ferrireducens]|uniref:DUF853 family protein n=1 Tax=Fusibacter ferrireducens TaxID=2785058 RepID=A0ABR9ZT41_9FIRM|nr:helicase HerA-like domain-containing protein [Fusibacter ferrireducens]MBF4693640.1 DUF853 family protein [Fusibacter ferrireducens]
MKVEIAKKHSGEFIELHSRMITRHGLITGATGTGKTVTLKLLAEKMASLGASVFLIDVKGDLNSFGEVGKLTSGLEHFLQKHDLEAPIFQKFSTLYWDIYNELGLPIRTTVMDFGPMLMAKLLKLNANQTNLLHTIYQIADDEGLLLLDFKDLTQLVKHLYDHNKAFEAEYGTLNKQSLGAIQRALIASDIDVFFGESVLEIKDLFLKDGIINILEASKLILNDKLYSAFLLWLLSELYEQLPEVGDLEMPKLVLFFDEAHLIFKGIPEVLLSKIEQVIKLIRSKGVGIFFISQSPSDIPDSIMAQLGNRIQHGIRSYTMKDIKHQMIPKEMLEKMKKYGVGEVSISVLDEDGVPTPFEEAVMLTPSSLIGKFENCNYYPEEQLNQKYRTPIDRNSAYEMLLKRQKNQVVSEQSTTKKRTRRGRKPDSMLTKLTKSLFSSFGRSLGTSLARGIMGTLKKY